MERQLYNFHGGGARFLQMSANGGVHKLLTQWLSMSQLSSCTPKDAE